MLEVRHLNVGYGRTQVLRDVSLDVPDGSVVALLGPNGAGKTTLLRAIAGLLPAMSGTVSFEGIDVTRSTPQHLQRRGLCYIPDGRAVFPNLTVRENLYLFADPKNVRGAEHRATDMFPALRDKLGQLAGTMSGGEQQMLALARAEISSATTVMLDEVSMGLAPRIVDELFEALRRVAASGKTLLVVEQYVQRALAIATWAVLLARGQIRFSGPPDELDPDEVLRSYVGVDLSESDVKRAGGDK